MSAYPDFTAAFDAALKGAALPEGATAVPPEEVAQRFAVYRNNVAVSLTAALAARFPVIRRLVGEAFFGAMARVYAETHRPQSPVLLAWGDSFAAFLASFPPLADYPYMADVARVEYARGVAFHAADARSASPDSFRDADPSRLTLRLHPSVQVLPCGHPAVSIWRHNQPGASPDSLTLAGPETALILRDRNFEVPVVAIGEGDAAMLEHLRQGATLTTAAELAQQAAPGHDAQPLIRHLMQTGAILDPKEDFSCLPC